MTFKAAIDAIERARESYDQRDAVTVIRSITEAIQNLQEVQGPLLIGGDFPWFDDNGVPVGPAGHPTVFTAGLTQLGADEPAPYVDNLAKMPAFDRLVQPLPLADPALRVSMPGPAYPPADDLVDQADPLGDGPTQQIPLPPTGGTQ